MARMISKKIARAFRLMALVSVSLIVCGRASLAQNSFDLGTPAEFKGGLSGMSTYAQDKIETVNLANGTLVVHIPLVTIGGRGSASFSVALSYNSKLWAGQQDLDSNCAFHHFSAAYNDFDGSLPNAFFIGAGWIILKAPAIKVRLVNMDPMTCPGGTGFKYLLTKAWLVLPDGSEVEMRDDATDGSPFYQTAPCNSHGDGNRGQVWHSTEGDAATYVTNAANGV